MFPLFCPLRQHRRPAQIDGRAAMNVNNRLLSACPRQLAADRCGDGHLPTVCLPTAGKEPGTRWPWPTVARGG